MQDVADDVIDVLDLLPGAKDIEGTDIGVILAALFGVIQARRVQRRNEAAKWAGASPGNWRWCDETGRGTDSEYHAELKVYPGAVQIEYWRGKSARYLMHTKDVESAKVLCEAKSLEAREVNDGE